MNKWITEGLNLMVSIPLGIVTWVVSFFSFGLGWIPSVVLMIAIPTTFYFSFKGIVIYSYMKKNDLSYGDYKLISNQIDEADKKVKRLNKALIRMKHLSSIKLRLDFMKNTKKLVNIVKKEPKKFYQVEDFFYRYLDSAVLLAEKYIILQQSPNKSFDYEDTLYITRKTLLELKPLIDDELHKTLNINYEKLQLEIDIARLSIEEQKEWKVKKDDE